jgi:hypothetical protein
MMVPRTLHLVSSSTAQRMMLLISLPVNKISKPNEYISFPSSFLSNKCYSKILSLLWKQQIPLNKLLSSRKLMWMSILVSFPFHCSFSHSWKLSVLVKHIGAKVKFWEGRGEKDICFFQQVHPIFQISFWSYLCVFSVKREKEIIRV